MSEIKHILLVRAFIFFVILLFFFSRCCILLWRRGVLARSAAASTFSGCSALRTKNSLHGCTKIINKLINKGILSVYLCFRCSFFLRTLGPASPSFRYWCLFIIRRLCRFFNLSGCWWSSSFFSVTFSLLES